MTIDNRFDFSTLELGREHPEIEIDTSEAVRNACIALFGEARREVVIMSRDLDPKVFDNASVVSALRQFLLSSRRTRLRVLVKDSETVARRGHRLIELTQRLSSYASIRQPAPEFSNQNTAFVLVDGTGLVYRGLANRYEATVSFNDRNAAREQLRQFDEMWESSVTAPSLRRISL